MKEFDTQTQPSLAIEATSKLAMLLSLFRAPHTFNSPHLLALHSQYLLLPRNWVYFNIVMVGMVFLIVLSAVLSMWSCIDDWGRSA